MWMIQVQFPRVKDDPLYKEGGERKVSLRLLVHFYNFQTEQVGIYEILNSYMKNKTGYCGYVSIIANANDHLV